MFPTGETGPGVYVLARWLMGAALALAVAPALASPLREAFDAAASLNAEIQALEGRRAEIDARLRGANALTPGAPSIAFGYTSDRLTQNRGFREAEVELGVPVWLPGQSRAQRDLAGAEAQRLAARIALQRLTLAGEVRDAYWTWATAEAALTAARARAASASALARDVARQARGGQVARADELLASADAREAEAGLREAEIAVREARLAFHALTGRDPRPGWEEAAREGAALAAEHPRLAAARLGQDVGRASLRVATVEDRDNPEVSIFGRQEQDERGAGWDSRLGVRVRIPFAHEPRNAERRAAAQTELTTAAAETATAQRLIAAEQQRARTALADARAAVRLADERHRSLTEAAGLSEAAYRAGQTGLAETLRIRAALAAADADRRRSQVALRQAASRYNQALGVEPR
ncbi:TolC family protein [Falsiroseomonas bella]|nr:TolC family protein [Falsiroseomonas bella]